MIDSCSSKWVDEFSVFICQKSIWFEWEIIFQKNFNAKKKCGYPTLKKERKISEYIKLKYRLFKIEPLGTSNL